MSDTSFDKPIMRWAAVWTRADALRVGDRILVQAEGQDLWAKVTAIESATQPARLHLQVVPESDNAPLGEHTHATPPDTAFLRRLPGELSR
jgi:hypothetical protein